MELRNDKCPACNSPRLWHMSTQMEGVQCIILFSCLDCDEKFKEIYDLVYHHTEPVK